MKVLARRANGLLIVAPICFVISLVVFSMATVFIFHIDSPEWFETLATNFFTSDYWGCCGRTSRAISHAMDSFVLSVLPSNSGTVPTASKPTFVTSSPTCHVTL